MLENVKQKMRLWVEVSKIKVKKSIPATRCEKWVFSPLLNDRVKPFKPSVAKRCELKIWAFSYTYNRVSSETEAKFRRLLSNLANFCQVQQMSVTFKNFRLNSADFYESQQTPINYSAGVC